MLGPEAQALQNRLMQALRDSEDRMTQRMDLAQRGQQHLTHQLGRMMQAQRDSEQIQRDSENRLMRAILQLQGAVCHCPRDTGAQLASLQSQIQRMQLAPAAAELQAQERP